MAAPASALLLDGGMGHLLKARGVGALPGLPALKYDELFLVGAVWWCAREAETRRT